MKEKITTKSKTQNQVTYRSGLLSPRETEVLTLSARGKKYAIIAHELSMSEDAVKDHLERVRKKLNTLNKTHSVAVAVSNGLVRP